MLCTYCLLKFTSDSERGGGRGEENNKKKKKQKELRELEKKTALVPNGATVCELSSQLSASSQLSQCCFSRNAQGLALRGPRPFSCLFASGRINGYLEAAAWIFSPCDCSRGHIQTRSYLFYICCDKLIFYFLCKLCKMTL